MAELMGRLANLVLIDPQGILRAVAKPVTSQMTRARTVLSGRRYEPPPPQHRRDPCATTAASVSEWLADAGHRGEPAWRAIVREVAGASPLSSREAVFRVAGKADAGPDKVDPVALADVIVDLFRCEQNSWHPTVAVSDGHVVAYAPYELRHMEGLPAASILSALAAYEDASASRDGYAAARDNVAAAIARAQLVVERRIAGLERQAAGADQADVFRRKGDLILAHQTAIAPRQALLRAVYTPGDAELEIVLDPLLAPVANAETYFARSKKAKRAGEGLPQRKQEAHGALAYLDQLMTDLTLAEDRSAIDEVAACLAAARLDPRAATAGSRAGPAPNVRAPRAGGALRLVSADGFTMWVGRNARQNEDVTFNRAAKGDQWLHARDVPGAHVVVKAAGRSVPESTVLQAASLAAWFSRLRDDASAAVMVTDARYVHRQPGGRPGMVTVDHERTVLVRPTAPVRP